MRILESLDNVQRIAIDSAPYIYYVENHPTYATTLDRLFEHIEARSIQVFTSTITLTEVLVKPIRAGDQNLIAAYRDLLTQTEAVRLLALSPAIAEQAAHLRARYQLRTPDSIQLASALHAS